MKALVYRTFGPADVLEWAADWPAPAESADTVLVRVDAGSINPKDVLLRKGKFSRTLARDALPRASGLDMAGRVVFVGEAVSGFAVGDAVYGMTNHFAGGVHAELARFQPTEIAHAPANISVEAVASVPLAAQTALQALRDCAATRPGQRVLINGASGGVGHFAVQIARAMGAEVHAVCGPTNRAFVKSLGADVVYSYADRPATAIDTRFDVVFDVFGKASALAFARQLGQHGIYVSTVPKPVTIWGEFLAKARISGKSRLVRVVSRTADLQQLGAWIEAGKIAPHVEKTFPVLDAASAHRHVETKRTIGKVCIRL